MPSSADILNAPLPTRWSRFQRWKNTVIYQLARVVLRYLKKVKLSRARTSARILGSIAAMIDIPDRFRAAFQLKRAFPQWPASRCKLTARRMFQHFAQLGVESFYPKVDICFQVQNPEQHYHVPLLLNPFGYTTYRGS